VRIATDPPVSRGLATGRDARCRAAPTGWAQPQRDTLPLHLRAAAAALFDDLPDPLPPSAVDEAAARLEQGRLRLSARVPSGTEVTVDAHRVRSAAGCPAAALGGDRPFGWSPATAARHLGLRAVALHLCGDADRAPRTIDQAVRTVMADLVATGAERTPGPWLAQLDTPGRAVAQAQAQRWAEQAVTWLPLRLVAPNSLRFLSDDWWPGGIRGGRTLVIHGRRDVTLDVGGRRVAVVVAGGAASGLGTADADAFGALAASLCDGRGRLVRMVRVHPASGEVVATDVNVDLLVRGVAVALATASALAAVDGQAATHPSTVCTWCERQDACRPGTEWLRRPDRRSMGLPVLSGPPGVS